MASGPQAGVLDGVRRIFDGGTAAASGPDSLLRRFASTGDEAAFEAIVARHGPMVVAVCRRALRDPHDVEDAFQATFLVLVRRAGSIRDGEGLGAWLHAVARRAAVRARAESSRRREREPSGLTTEPAAPGDDPDRAEVAAAVDEEIGRLPERYRRAIVLCDLEGCTQPEAADRLGWTEGSVRGRLARGREMLRSRLRRRGLVAPAGAIGGAVAADAATAARLGEELIRGGIQGAAPGAGGVSASAAVLARGTLRTMAMHKLMTAGLAALVAGVAMTGVGVSALRSTEADDTPKQAGRPPRAAAAPGPGRQDEEVPVGGAPARPRFEDLPEPKAPGAEPADARRMAGGDLLTIEVLEALPGRPITGERLVRPDGTVSLGFYGDLKLAGLTRREAKVKVVEHLLEYLTPETLGLIVWDERVGAFERLHPSRSNRVFVDDSPTFNLRGRERLGRAGEPAGGAGPRPVPASGPMRLQPGDSVVIELLVTLPGRPLTGVRPVRPDGTVGLGWYGDLKLAGLTRDEAKVKIIEHCREWLTDEALGLVVKGKDGTAIRVPPERSTCVFIDEVDRAEVPPSTAERIEAVERKLDRVLQELEALRKERSK